VVYVEQFKFYFPVFIREFQEGYFARINNGKLFGLMSTLNETRLGKRSFPVCCFVCGDSQEISELKMLKIE
jgi:hypothetical protein